MSDLTEHQENLLEGYGASRWSEGWDEHGNEVIELTQKFCRCSWPYSTETRVMGTVTPEEWASPLDLGAIEKAAEGNEMQREIKRMTSLLRRMQAGARWLRDEAERRNDYSDHHGWSEVSIWAAAILVGAEIRE